jgi:hypothetical protein
MNSWDNTCCGISEAKWDPQHAQEHLVLAQTTTSTLHFTWDLLFTATVTKSDPMPHTVMDIAGVGHIAAQTVTNSTLDAVNSKYQADQVLYAMANGNSQTVHNAQGPVPIIAKVAGMAGATAPGMPGPPMTFDNLIDWTTTATVTHNGVTTSLVNGGYMISDDGTNILIGSHGPDTPLGALSIVNAGGVTTYSFEKIFSMDFPLTPNGVDTFDFDFTEFGHLRTELTGCLMPEPSTITLLSIGFAGLLGHMVVRRRIAAG